MAKRKRPDPAVTAKWVEELRRIMQRKARQQIQMEELDKLLEKTVVAAFDDGVLVGDLKDATGYSGSRLYQLKFAERDRQLAASRAEGA